MDRLTYACILGGMALYWPLLRRHALFYSLAGHDGTPLQAMVWYTVFLLLVLCAVVWCARRSRLSVQRASPALVAVFVAYALGKGAEVFWQPGGPLGLVLAFVGVAGFAVVLVVLTCLWASVCVALERRTAALVAVASFAISFAVKEFWTIPAGVGLGLMVCTPLFSLALWGLSDRRLPPLSQRSGPAEGAALFPGGLVAVMAVFMVAAGIVRGVRYDTLTGSLISSNVGQDLLTVACAAALFVVLFLGHSGGRLVQRVWSVGAVLVFAGLLLMVALGGSWMRTGGEIVVVGRTCLGLLFWIILADLVRSGGYSLPRTFGGVFLLVEVVSAFLGYVAVPEAMKLLDIRTTNAVTFLLMVIAFALIVATMVFFNRVRPDPVPAMPLEQGFSPSTPGSVPAEPEAAPGASVPTELFAAYGLTEREVEVATLLAAGNSQRKISELLSVSIGTVQSHIKAIYRKFDIHSRQEFIDALSRTHS